MDYRKDYYALLEIPVTASREEIRAAYRRLAKLYHPDKNTGNPDAEERFKEINEANEILSNETSKKEYDDYRAEQERWQREREEEQKAEKEAIKPANKKTYIKTNTIVAETRLYVKGVIRVKYWASTDQSVTASYDTELDYTIHPTEAVITINEQNIFPTEEIPEAYLRARKESDIFKTPLPQPVRCEIEGKNGKEYFDLSLNDIRIKNIKLEGVTKHEKHSYGTLTGEVYGYSPRFIYTEEEVTVTECFGETGKTERKEENGFTYIRKEYYLPDCSTYWGQWIPLPKPRTYNRPYQPDPVKNAVVPDDPGCGLFVWIIALLSILYLSPRFFIFCLVMIFLAFLLHYGGTIFSTGRRFISALATALLFLFIITAVRSFSGGGSSYIKKKERKSTVKTTRSIRQSKPAADTASASPDSLITHFIKWRDYTGNQYQGNISISLAALRNASTNHRQMNGDFYQDMGEVYSSMLDHNTSGLDYFYETFDSIKNRNKLDEVAFAQVIVSAVQSLPYFLVVDKNCNDDYSDDFTRNYLANCNRDCCIGNELFGIRSPVEFLSDLKGDCDTRSLLLYQVLRHYGYNVALLTSNHYKHAMIAVNFMARPVRQGSAININGKRYYMWETTSPDLDYGNISASLNDLSYWNISLINKNLQ